MWFEALSGAATALLSAFVAAQEPATEQSPPPELTQDETIYVRATADDVAVDASIATKLPVPLDRTPFSIGVVTSGVIEEQDARTLSDAASNVSGVSAQPQNGVGDSLMFRGLDTLESGLLLIDGAPEPEVSHYQLYNVKRVEILKGPAGFLYGSNPISGAVNLVRTQADRAWLHGHRASAGSFETYRYEVDVNTRGEGRGAAFRFNGLYGESEGFRDRQGNEVLGVNPNLTWWIGEESSLRLNTEWLQSDYQPDSGLPFADGEVIDVPRERSYQSPFDFSEQDVLRLRLDWDSALGDSWRLHDKLYYNDLDWQTAGTIVFGTVPTPTSLLVLRALNELDDVQEFVGNQFEATRTGERHTLLLGVEVIERTDEFTITPSLLQPIDAFDPVESDLPPIPLPIFGEVGDAEIEQIAPYVVERFEVGERFSMFAGARYDRFEFTDPTRNRDLEEDQVSPSLGVLYAAGSTSVYASYSEGFSPPSTRTVGDLEPEEGQQLEVGLKFRAFDSKLSGSAAVYDLDRENLSIFAPTGLTAQLGSQQAQGFDLDLVGTPADGLRLQLAYGYTDAELTRFNERLDVSFFPPEFVLVDRAGNRPAFAPEHVVNMWVIQQFRSGLALGGGGRYLSEQFLAPNNELSIDSSTVFDAMASYSLRRLRFSLNVKNLTDEEYFRRGFGASSAIPADGRSYTVGVEFRP